MPTHHTLPSIEETFALAWETGQLPRTTLVKLCGQSSQTPEAVAILDRLMHAIRRGRIRLID